MGWLVFFFTPVVCKAFGVHMPWPLAILALVCFLLTYCLWCVKISAARGKGVFTTLALILPVISLFAFLYLAFSDAAEGTGSEDKIVVKPVVTEPRKAA